MSEKDLVQKMNLTPSQKPNKPVKPLEQSTKTPSVPKPTTSQLLWEKLKDTELNLFGIPNQKLSDYCDSVNADPTKLYLKLKDSKKAATAVISALDEALHPKYNVEIVDKYFVVTEV